MTYVMIVAKIINFKVKSKIRAMGKSVMHFEKGELSKSELHGLLARVYNTSYMYFIQKFDSNLIFDELQTNPQKLAIETTAVLFLQNGSSEILLHKKLKRHFERIFDENEFYYYFNRIVRETADSVIKFEMLKMDLIGIEE